MIELEKASRRASIPMPVFVRALLAIARELAGSEASYIMGVTLNVDGGQIA